MECQCCQPEIFTKSDSKHPIKIHLEFIPYKIHLEILPYKNALTKKKIKKGSKKYQF